MRCDCPELPSVWPAPAKLNLFLHVTGRRPDGYHTLQTVFQFIELGDELRFTTHADGLIRRQGAIAGVSEDADLTLRAARALQAHTGTDCGVTVVLQKRIPAGGGLGGGSSDAATTLIALNHLWGLHRPRAELAELGLRLGADVPVFIHGHAAWAEGVGERLSAIELDEPWYIVLAPSVQVSTASVFADSELTRHSPAIKIRDFRAGQTRNDLEPIVRRRYPEVDTALSYLSRFGPARLTGSGGCVFLRIEDSSRGDAILAARPEGTAGFLTRGMNRHPLADL